MITRILIADRQNMFREVLRRLLDLQPDFSVVGDTDDGERLVQLVAEQKPDILLLDLNLRTRSGIEALQEISSQHTGVRAILLTDTVGAAAIPQALLCGASGIVRKDDPTHLLFKSIRSVAAGGYWINHDQVAELVDNLRSLSSIVEQKAQQQARNLSCRQQQIIEAIVAGCSNKDIAQEMLVSERTVKYHLTRIFEKLGVSGRMELARFSLKNKVVREA
jgi:two-component system, NarL family, response regulator DegU